jgi:hypothetical protein
MTSLHLNVSSSTPLEVGAVASESGSEVEQKIENSYVDRQLGWWNAVEDQTNFRKYVHRFIIEEVLGKTTVTISSRLPLTEPGVIAFEDSWLTVRAPMQRRSDLFQSNSTDVWQRQSVGQSIPR